MLSGVCRQYGHRDVPLVLSGDNHGVEVLVLEHVPEIVVGLGLRSPALGAVDLPPIDIAQAGHRDIPVCRQPGAVFFTSARDIFLRTPYEASIERPATSAAH